MLLLTAGCSLFGQGSEEGPSYKVVEKVKDKEIRKYDSYIVAKTTIKGSFEETQSKGFKILAGYVFGDNTSKKKIAMTAPVVQKAESEKIAMTAPVVMKASDNQSWTMTFSMPSAYTIETLPVPTDSRIVIEKVEARYVAAITFTGFWGEEKNAKKTQELQEWLKSYPSYQSVSGGMFAGYNPPWTLPFMRRNEMLIELQTVE